MSQAERLDELTAREREVLDLVRLGLTNEEIASRLGITEAGVKYHVSQILSKLGVTTREETAALALAERRWWAALPLAAKAAGAAVVLGAVLGLGLLAWGVLRTSDDQEPSLVESPTPGAPQVFTVEGAGMAPTLSNGMEVGVIPYDGRLPDRGDIVVFTSPIAVKRSFVKRVIGTPGDEIEIDNGQLKVNGGPVPEPYTVGLTLCVGDTCAWQIPDTGTPESQEACGSARCYFVLGDNRQNSSDSRQGWLVPLEKIHGWVEPPSPTP